MTTEIAYPVCILEAGEGYVEHIATFGQEATTLAEAKALVAAAGYHVIDEGEGGCCTLHAPDGETPEWAITVTEHMDTFKLTSGYDKRKNPASATFRPMTVSEAKALRSGSHATIKATDGSARQVKINGTPKVWKRQPGRVEVPIKYGMYEYGKAESVNPNGDEGGPVTYLVVQVDGDPLF